MITDYMIKERKRSLTKVFIVVLLKPCSSSRTKVEYKLKGKSKTIEITDRRTE